MFYRAGKMPAYVDMNKTEQLFRSGSFKFAPSDFIYKGTAGGSWMMEQAIAALVIMVLI
jgi:hypothetical protein